MIKAVIFDIDGVLLDSFEANLQFFQKLMTKAGYSPPERSEFRPMFHLSMMGAIRALTKSESEEEITRIWELGRGDEVEHDLSLLSMPEGAKGVIEKLHAKHTLGIVTSRMQGSVYEYPKLAQLEKYFQVAVAYEDTENHKPHPQPLLFAAEKLGIQPAQCVYIGDVENDMKAARAAGMKIIIYSQNKLDQADACTAIFTELPELISLLERRR